MMLYVKMMREIGTRMGYLRGICAIFFSPAGVLLSLNLFMMAWARDVRFAVMNTMRQDTPNFAGICTLYTDVELWLSEVNQYQLTHHWTVAVPTGWNGGGNCYVMPMPAQLGSQGRRSTSECMELNTTAAENSDLNTPSEEDGAEAQRRRLMTDPARLPSARLMLMDAIGVGAPIGCRNDEGCAGCQQYVHDKERTRDTTRC